MAEKIKINDEPSEKLKSDSIDVEYSDNLHLNDGNESGTKIPIIYFLIWLEDAIKFQYKCKIDARCVGYSNISKAHEIF